MADSFAAGTIKSRAKLDYVLLWRFSFLNLPGGQELFSGSGQKLPPGAGAKAKGSGSGEPEAERHAGKRAGRFSSPRAARPALPAGPPARPRRPGHSPAFCRARSARPQRGASAAGALCQSESVPRPASPARKTVTALGRADASPAHSSGKASASATSASRAGVSLQRPSRQPKKCFQNAPSRSSRFGPEPRRRRAKSPRSSRSVGVEVQPLGRGHGSLAAHGLARDEGHGFGREGVRGSPGAPGRIPSSPRSRAGSRAAPDVRAGTARSQRG